MAWPTRRVSVTVSVAPQRLWPLVTDIELPARFSGEFLSAEWLVGAAPAEGAVFRGYNENQAIGAWHTDSTVTAFRVPELFEWTVGELDSPIARWRFEIGDGELAQTVELGPGESAMRHYIAKFPHERDAIIEARLRVHEENMRRTVEGIAALAAREQS
jgi:hypothetical protein